MSVGDRRHDERSGAAPERVKEPDGKFDDGLGFFMRRGLAWLIDYVISAGLVSVFYFCAGVFYLDAATRERGDLMLLCAVVTVLLITTYIPYTSGKTIGQHMTKIEVVRRDGLPRTLVQVFAQECVLKLACGPFVAAFYALDYMVMGLIMHRDFDHDPTLDYFLKIRVVPAARRA